MEYTVYSILPIFLFPFTAFVINAFFGKKLPRQGDWLSVGAIFGSFLYTLRIFSDFVFGVYSENYHIHKFFTWIDLTTDGLPFKIDMGIYIDNMTATMLLMVTGCATLIHLFSTYYMKGDKKYGKFFVFLSLFTSAMIGLVLSDNLLSLFIFWEIMGFCSYSLIGFYHEEEGAGDASIKAFMTTRVGDVILLLGILTIWTVVGNVTYVDLYKAIAAGSFDGVSIMGIAATTFAGFCIFCGTIGKSAQFPLQVWLPDAMWGPTPCSALIHAATMVAAGVYLSLRVYPLIEAGGLNTFVAYIGAITAFGAATIALVQTDLKAVLAYSTISQLGYMVLGVGVGSYNAAFMHVVTHAVFKACLFMSAGSVIHSIHIKDMRKMGGLRKKLPLTHFAMLCCSLAIAGVPFFSGFVSKDRILGDALFYGTYSTSHILIPVLGFVAAVMTAFYMFRMMCLTFYGEPRDKEAYDHCHKEHFSIGQNLPLLILSVFTLGIFYSGSFTGQGIVKVFGHNYEWFQTLIQKPVPEKFATYTKSELGVSDDRVKNPEAFPEAHYHAHHDESEAGHALHSAHVSGAIISVILAGLGVFFAFFLYFWRKMDPGIFVRMFKPWYVALQNKYYFDDLYIGVLIKKGLNGFNKILAFFDMGIVDRFAVDGWKHVNKALYSFSGKFDNYVVDNIVDGNGILVNLGNLGLRVLQSGRLQFYFLVSILVLGLYVVSVI